MAPREFDRFVSGYGLAQTALFIGALSPTQKSDFEKKKNIYIYICIFIYERATRSMGNAMS